ncbi:unnamed protein product [Rotaria socialis]|uniref:Peptidase C14 caspase domain-containing protein n=1 Tax=Rotaria socialis TaxID=392032 RepID=A0A818RJV7_9BILA|nr:unnamed protein product [Rotaria socialis]CAF3655207.1 unnamed protein product [Rotaria socialis]CAF4256549.1 unnamed protein product [Rotaria socialis]CAF4373286.1 unnamed protein product [Rotaria socialis]
MLAKQALTIGINAYVPANMALESCIHDAKDVSNALALLGFQAYCVTDVSFKSMNSVIYQFVDAIQPDSIVVFYFSGHGVQYDGKNYLIPKNGLGTWTGNVTSRTIDVQQLIYSMHAKQPRVVICILDCCRTNPSTERWNANSIYRTIFGGTKLGFASMQVPPSTIIAYACAADAMASSMSRNGRNSLYTYHLLRRIKIPNIDIKTILKFVGIDVQNESDYNQIPFQYSSCNETIYLGMNAPYKRLISPYLMQKRPIIQSRHRRQSKPLPTQYSTSQLKHFNKQLYSQYGMLMNHHHSLPKYHPSPYKTRVSSQYDHRFLQNVRHH